MAGKGSKRRQEDPKKIRANWDEIDWKRPKWPTLEGRLSQPLVSEKEALEQLQKSIPLSPLGQRRLDYLRKHD